MSVERPLRILLLEDDPGDAQLVRDILDEEAFVCEIEHAQTRPEFVAALENDAIDLILADYRLPAFDGMSALDLVLETRPELPFIFVSGALGEELAIEALKKGATDFVLKTGLSRLVPAMRRALRETGEKLERKKAQEALRASERNLRLLHEQFVAAQQVSATGSFTTDMVADEHLWSEELYRIFEFEPGSTVTSKRNRDAIHPDDLLQYDVMIARIVAGEIADFKFRIVTARGTVKHLHCAARISEDAAGRRLFMGAVQDVTDSEIAEAALVASEAELRRVNQYLTVAQELSKTGSYARDVRTDEQTLSDEMYRIMEFDPAKKVTHAMVLGRIHPEDLAIYEEVQRVAFAAGEDFKAAYRIVTDTGAVKHLRSVSRRLTEITDRLVYFGATQDVTEMKSAEEALHRARAELAHVARVTALGALTASIAHEVNQPLTGIVNNANTCLRMLAANPPNLDGARTQVQRMLRDGNRAAEVIQRLRAMFSRKQPTTEPVDLNEAAREVIALSASDLNRSRVVLRTDFEEVLPHVRGDRVQLQQVILNLIANAADAMRTVDDRPRNLLVSTSLQDASCVRLSVRDSGVGIAPDDIDKLFDAFYTTKSHGMGVGLSVSHSIITSHEGRLWATGNDGPGATFSFAIPRAPEATAAV